MKFMQRAAATKGAGTGASLGTGPQTLTSEPPSKRRRVESTNSAASTPGKLSDSELGPVMTAERVGRTIYARQGEETEWVLNIAPPKVATGRQTYGSFQKKTDRKDQGGGGGAGDGTNNDDDLSSVSGSLPDSEDDDRHTPAAKCFLESVDETAE
ncbi:hypothetical protein DV736_g1443, partial [Chaetothyriales sp. CBS 134916]